MHMLLSWCLYLHLLYVLLVIFFILCLHFLDHYAYAHDFVCLLHVAICFVQTICKYHFSICIGQFYFAIWSHCFADIDVPFVYCTPCLYYSYFVESATVVTGTMFCCCAMYLKLKF